MIIYCASCGYKFTSNEKQCPICLNELGNKEITCPINLDKVHCSSCRWFLVDGNCDYERWLEDERRRLANREAMRLNLIDVQEEYWHKRNQGRRL